MMNPLVSPHTFWLYALACGTDMPKGAGGEGATATIPGDADPLHCLWPRGPANLPTLPRLTPY